MDRKESPVPLSLQGSWNYDPWESWKNKVIQSNDNQWKEWMPSPTKRRHQLSGTRLLLQPQLEGLKVLPSSVAKHRSWAHHIYQCVRTTKLDMGKAHTQGWESVLSQWFHHRLVFLSCDHPRFTWKAEIEYVSSLSKRKPILVHDSSPLEAQAPNFSKEEFTPSGL